jgi:hypothetical protein
MAKTKISELDAAAANNTDINSVDVSEGCAPSGINNAIREMGAMLKRMDNGTDHLTNPNITGDLDVDNININGNTISSTDTNGNINITPNGTGAVAFTTNATFGDNDKAVFGAGSDLQIYHNSSNGRSYITESGSGAFVIQGENLILEETGGNNYIQATAGGAVQVYHNGSERLATSASGIDVTGSVTADGLTVNGDADVSSANPRIRLFETDTTDLNTQLQSNGGEFVLKTLLDDASNSTTRIKVAHSTGDISFYADDGTTQSVFFDASTQRLGLGTTGPTNPLHISSSAGEAILISNSSASGNSQIKLDGATDFQIGTGQASSGFANKLFIYDATNAATRMVITDGGLVGIGITPAAGNGTLQLSGGLRIAGSASASDTTSPYIFRTAGTDNMAFATSGSEAARIDSSGNVAIGTTTASSELTVSGRADITNNGLAAILERTGTDGNILQFKNDGTEIGRIGNQGSGLYIATLSGSDSGLLFAGSNIRPCTTTGGGRDNAIDLGASSVRFDDIFATNGTIQTSDANEKNTITDSDLGLDFINRLEPKSYVFNGKTRTHYGLIAQDVETVLGDISKPTSGFAGFIKSDISEEQDGSEYRYGLRYTEFVGPLIKALQEADAKIEALEARIAALEGA